MRTFKFSIVMALLTLTGLVWYPNVLLASVAGGMFGWSLADSLIFGMLVWRNRMEKAEELFAARQLTPIWFDALLIGSLCVLYAQQALNGGIIFIIIITCMEYVGRYKFSNWVQTREETTNDDEE